MNKGIIICDIDGTLAKVGQRQLILEHEPVDWEAFYADDFNDEPISEMCWLVGRLMESGYDVVFCTSRRECVREKTERWLYNHIHCNKDLMQEREGQFSFRLLMRSDGDARSCDRVKPDLLRWYLKKEDMARIAFVLEDDAVMVKTWVKLGYKCLQVHI